MFNIDGKKIAVVGFGILMLIEIVSLLENICLHSFILT